MESIYFEIDECTPQPKERKGHRLCISHHVGDKLTFYIYCSDTKKIVSRSNIRSADPTRRGIIIESIDKPIGDPIPTSSYDPNIEIDSTTSKIPVSGGGYRKR